MPNPWEAYSQAKPAPIDNAIAAEAQSPEEEAYLRSIFQQESSSGANTKTSNRGAVGIGQIQPGTFKEVADKGWDINNPHHNAQASARYALKHFRDAGGNAIVAAAGYYGGPGGASKAKEGVARSDPQNPSAPDTIEYGKEVANRLPPWQKYVDAATIAAPALLAGGVANMQNTMQSVKEGVVDAYNNATGDKYDKMLVELNGLAKSGVPATRIQQMRQNILEQQKNDPSSRVAVEAMHNVVPHDFPILGLGIKAFTNTALGKQLYEASKGVPYLDVLGSGFASDTPSKLDIAAGQTMDKFGAGLGDLVDNIRITVGSPETVNQAVESMSNRRRDQDEKDKIMAEFSKNSGFGGAIGHLLPYLLTGEYIGKPLMRGAGKLTSAIADVPGEVITEGKGLLTRGINKAATSGIPVLSTVGKMAQNEFTIPWAERALHNARANQPWTSMFKSHGGSILGPALLGAAESGLHYDQTMGEGALSSVLGQKIGERISPWLTRGHDYRADIPGEAPLRDMAYKEGWNATPGEDLGNQFYQRFEAGLRNNGNYADRLKKWDVANIKTRNQSAFESIGIPRKSMDALTPENLIAHENNLKQQYNKWVDGAIGSFDFNDRIAVRNHLKTLVKNTTEEGINATKTAQYYADQMEKTMGVKRNALGQMQPSIINGEEFQTLRSDLKGEISNAWDKGDRVKAKALQPLLDTLDGAIEKGVRRQGGDPEANIAAFRELNRKWAVTEALKQYGLTHLGSFDPIKFADHAMARDTSRYLKETGGAEMNKLFEWAKHAKMNKQMAGSDLGGMGVHAESLAPKRTLLNTLLQPFNVNTPLTDPFLRAYLAGWPAKTGLLNMSGKKFGDPTLYLRALSASRQPWPTLYNKAEDTVNDTIEGVDKVKRDIIEELKKKGIIE